VYLISTFSGEQTDISQYLMVAEYKERLAVSKQVSQKFDIEELSLKKLNDVDWQYLNKSQKFDMEELSLKKLNDVDWQYRNKSQKFDMEELSLKKLNDVEVKEQYQVKISNRFAALENVDDDVDIHSIGNY
jgi:type II secretory pathway component PulK